MFLKKIKENHYFIKNFDLLKSVCLKYSLYKIPHDVYIDNSLLLKGKYGLYNAEEDKIFLTSPCFEKYSKNKEMLKLNNKGKAILLHEIVHKNCSDLPHYLNNGDKFENILRQIDYYYNKKKYLLCTCLEEALCTSIENLYYLDMENQKTRKKYFSSIIKYFNDFNVLKKVKKLSKKIYLCKKNHLNVGKKYIIKEWIKLERKYSI